MTLNAPAARRHCTTTATASVLYHASSRPQDDFDSCDPDHHGGRSILRAILRSLHGKDPAAEPELHPTEGRT